MGVPFSELVDPEKMAELRAAVGDPDDLEEKKDGPRGRTQRDKTVGRSAEGGEPFTRDGIGRFASDGDEGKEPAGRPRAGGAEFNHEYRDRDGQGGRRRVADGGIDRDGDGDSDPALGKDGFPKVGSLDDVRRQVAGWEDNIPPAKRREAKERLLDRARELGASDEVLERIKRLPAPPADKKGDDEMMEWKEEAPRGIEHKADPGLGGAQVLESDPKTGRVLALVSVTGVEDRVKDIIEPGAYAKTLATREPIGVWSHDDKTWVARTEHAEELPPGHPFLKDLKTMDGQPWPADAGAVKVEAQFNLATPHGAAAFSDVEFFKGKTGWSIGYRATKAYRNPRTGVRHIKELDWFEFSPVMVGAASQPMTLSVKSLADAYSVDPQSDDGLVTEVILTPGELAKYAELKASLGLEVKARVRTPEGAARYGQPIGSIIIPDLATTINAGDLKVGMTVDFQGMGPGGPSDPMPVKGKVEKVVTNGSITEVTVGGKTHKVGKNNPIDVDPKDVPLDTPLQDRDLVAMLKVADDDDERAKIREAIGLPPGKRRAFLTGAKEPAGDAPATPTRSPAAQALLDRRAKPGEPSLLDPPPRANTPAQAQQRAEAMGRQGNGFAKFDGPDTVDMTGSEISAELGKLHNASPKDPAERQRLAERYAELSNERTDRIREGSWDGKPVKGTPVKLKVENGGLVPDKGDDGSGPADRSPAAKPAAVKPAAAKPAAKVNADAVDNVNIVIDQLRDEGGDERARTEELQGLLDDYEKQPSPDTAAALRGFFEQNTDLRGLFVDDALTALGGERESLEDAKRRWEAEHDANKTEFARADAEERAKRSKKPPTMRERITGRRDESRNPEAARERDERADRARERARSQDAEADQKVKDQQKLAALNKRRRARGQAPLLRLPASMKSLDLGEWTDAELDVKVYEAADVEYGDPDLEAKGSRASLNRSPKQNWVEKAGELPGYIREVARAVEREQGVSLDRAIPIAIGRIKKWARGGGGVKPDTVAKAAAAVAAWEALKAKSGKKYDSELLDHLEEKALAVIAAYELLVEAGELEPEHKSDQPLENPGDTMEVKTEEVPDVADLFARGASLRASLS